MLSLGKVSRASHLASKLWVRSLAKATAAATPTPAPADKPFDKILIANRGEIACRIIRTAKRLGVKTVAVYSDADANSMFVRQADEKVHIGPPQSKDSYLRMDKIIDACKKTGAQAVHPGYGFLSENSKFVELCEKEGIVFIGPTAAPMLALGDKINSKKIAKDAGCFVIPGYQGEVRDENHAVELVKEIGYPVMVKASAGGGGKGMRVCYNEVELKEGFRLSKSESMASFGDDRMLIERFIEDPHHIEIQVLADSHGNVVAFPERECSVQRRNQKVVEEAPSCLLTPKTRKMMQEQAIMLCKAVNYRSAGTIEMLCDGKQNFYFLEMNTRLQVEHPITEMISGEDLVEHMLWVAAGKQLPERLTKDPCLGFNGWAIESRVYAEDPLRNFLPSIGPLITYREPEKYATKDGACRIDSGVYEGGVISQFYDPMISKLCTWGKTRDDAIVLMEKALDQYVVHGLSNNLAFCRSVMRNKVFREGKYGTGFIPEQYPQGFKGVELTPSETLEMIATTAIMHQNCLDVQASADEYANAGEDIQSRFAITVNNHVYDVEIDRTEEDVKVHISPLNKDGSHMKTETVDINSFMWMTEDPLCEISLTHSSGKDKSEHQRIVQYEGRTADGYAIRFNGSQNEVIVRTPLEQELGKHMIPAQKKDFSKFLLSPMPGTLISLSAKEGQHVESGQQLAVVEAMKMQNVLRAAKAGTIKSIKVNPGATLKVDQIIIEFEGPAPAEKK